MTRFMLSVAAFAVLIAPAMAQEAPKKEAETSAAERIAQALREKKDVEIRNQPLTKVADTLTVLLGVPVELDPTLVAWWGPGVTPLTVSVRGNKAPVAGTLSRALQPWGMTHVIYGEKLILTTTDRALGLQMTQQVHGTVKDQPLSKALNDLARQYGLSITVDAHASKEAEKPVSMQMNGTGLEAVVTILAANAGLHVARLDNALFVTTPERARSLPRDLAPMPPPPVPMGGFGGMIGAIGGQPGGDGAIGLRGNLGIFGGGGALGGGAFGAFGGGRGVPPPPPVQKKSSSLPGRYPLLQLVKAAPVPDKGKSEPGESPARKLARELSLPATVEFVNVALPQAITLLREKTGVDLVLDRAVLDPYFQERNPNGTGMDGVMVSAKLNKTPLRRGLRSILSEFDLGFVVIGEQVLITTQPMTSVRQLRQPIAVDVDKVSVADALKKLARDAAVNLVVDSRAAKEAQEKVSLQLEEVALDTAVKLLAEQAGLKAVFVDNVVFVTTKARAIEMREDPDFRPRDPMIEGRVVPGGPGGMGMGIGPMVLPMIPPVAPPAKGEDKPERMK